MLQDANYNVMALCDSSGAVVEQYQWTPYGERIVKDTLATFPGTNPVGHQGLFAYTFTTGTGSAGLYYNRNRWYSPHLGRFLEKDPNGLGQPLLRSRAFGGYADWDMSEADCCDNESYSCCGGCTSYDDSCVDCYELEPEVDASANVQDGLGLYTYEQADPVSGQDPDGLFLLAMLGGIKAENGLRAGNADKVIKAGIAAAGLTTLIYLYSEALSDILADSMARTKQYDESNCWNLYYWCLSVGGRNCWNAWRFCKNNGWWDRDMQDLPWEADPYAPPSGYE